MLLGITLEGHICWLAFIIYFLCHTGISSVQSTNHVSKFAVHNNKTAPGSSIKCTVGEYINIVEVYGFQTSFFAIDQTDVAMIHDACSCQQTCDIPHLATTPFSSWNLYVKFKCLGTCADTTTVTEISTTLTTSSATTVTATTVSSTSTSTASTAATTSSAPSSTTNSPISSESSSSMGYRKSTTNRNEMRKHTIDENGNDPDKVVPIAVSACLFIAGVACCIVGCAVYRRRHTKQRNKDTTERKEIEQYSNLDEHSETAIAGISDYTQSEPHGSAIAKEDEGYESIEFVERLRGHDNSNKILSHECNNVLSPPLVALAPSRIQGTKRNRQNRFGETAGSNGEEHINMYDDVYDGNNSTACTKADTLEDPHYLHAVVGNTDLHNKSRAETNEGNDQTAEFITESSITASPVCITQSSIDDLSDLSVLDNVQTVPKTGFIAVDSCIEATSRDLADSGYVKPVTCS